MIRQKKRRIDRQTAKDSVEISMLLSVIVLHEEFGFGEKRLSRFMDALNRKTESLDSCRVSDVVEKVEEVTGWKIEL